MERISQTLMSNQFKSLSLAILTICVSILFSVASADNVYLSRTLRDDVPTAVQAPAVSSGQTDTGSEPSKPVESAAIKLNCSEQVNVNDTRCLKDDGYVNSIMNQMSENKGMLLRTFYVSLGVTGLVVTYFVVRSIRLKRRRSKSRKYGIITQHDHGDVEMEPLGDGNEDDDDYTVFEMNGRK